MGVLLSWLALAIQSQGQVIPVPLANEPPPVSGLIDGGDFFSKNSGAFNRISEHLRKLEKDHGYKIYLVVEPVLITTTASELAARLRQAWAPDGNGLVLVFESDSHRLGTGWDLTSPQDRLQENGSRVPSHETSAMLARARESTDGSLAAEPYIETLVTNLVREHEGYFTRRADPPPPERSVRMGLLMVGSLALLGLGSIAVGALVRHSSMAGARRFRFPVVDRPERLGAPCGGGVTTRRFAPPVSKS